jgi:hypothetical protein
MGFWTAIELFIGGIRGWEGHLRRCMALTDDSAQDLLPTIADMDP